MIGMARDHKKCEAKNGQGRAIICGMARVYTHMWQVVGD